MYLVTQIILVIHLPSQQDLLIKFNIFASHPMDTRNIMTTLFLLKTMKQRNCMFACQYSANTKKIIKLIMKRNFARKECNLFSKLKWKTLNSDLVYLLKCIKCDSTYVGQTFQWVKSRIALHKSYVIERLILLRYKTRRHRNIWFPRCVIDIKVTNVHGLWKVVGKNLISSRGRRRGD